MGRMRLFIIVSCCLSGFEAVRLLMCCAELSDWLVNAFNGEWLKTDRPEPVVTGLDGLEGLG